jgi:hypothetical protein
MSDGLKLNLCIKLEVYQDTQFLQLDLIIQHLPFKPNNKKSIYFFKFESSSNKI